MQIFPSINWSQFCRNSIISVPHNQITCLNNSMSKLVNFPAVDLSLPQWTARYHAYHAPSEMTMLEANLSRCFPWSRKMKGVNSKGLAALSARHASPAIVGSGQQVIAKIISLKIYLDWNIYIPLILHIDWNCGWGSIFCSGVCEVWTKIEI